MAAFAVPSLSRAAGEGDLRVYVVLRSSGDDVIDVCRDESFGKSHAEAQRALDFGDAIGESLHLAYGSTGYDPDYDDHCVFLNPDTPLTGVGSRRHERTFFLDAATLAGYATQEGYRALKLWVCTPALPTTVRVRESLRVDASECEELGFRWTGAGKISLTFRATRASLGRGIAAMLGYWGVAFGLAMLLFTCLDRSGRWRFFARRAVTTSIAIGFVVVVTGLVWTIFMMHWSNLVDSLKMFFGVGIPGEIYLAVGPWLTFALYVVMSRELGVRRVRREDGRPI